MTEHMPAQTSVRDPDVDPSEIHDRRPTLSRLRAESRAAIAEILSSLGCERVRRAWSTLSGVLDGS